MGYTTYFSGRFELDKPLTEEQAKYLEDFSNSRRMKRDATLVATFPDEVREAVKLPIGDEGGYYVGSYCGQGKDESIKVFNFPPSGQPGLWCQWVPTEDNKGIEWDGNEKFYDYFKWLNYLIVHFLKPWGLTLNGQVHYRGEESDDRGYIRVEDNMILRGEAQVSFVEYPYETQD